MASRSSELDSNIAPSPPMEQEHFQKSSTTKEDAFSVPIKQLTKKIRGLKKKLKHFDEGYEADYGYKPSHAEKTNYPEAKKLLNELHKARKELKALKDESHLISAADACVNWMPTRDVHILEDTTNCLRDQPRKSKSSIQKSFDDTLKSLDGDRKLANRPELLENMTKDQVKDEKLAIQKVLLHFESIHGKPSKKNDRNTIRPLYERYRNIKRLLVKSNSLPVSKTAMYNNLEPIMEHEAMDFRASIEELKLNKHKNIITDCSDAVNQDIIKDAKPQPTCFKFLDNKYNNSNLHELPLPEMIFQQHQTRMEKRRLRKILHEFEDEFMKVNGRKIQKEEKAPVETLYEEYKLVKARLRLLEALISKHNQEHATA